jgi:hypothetical protein
VDGRVVDQYVEPAITLLECSEAGINAVDVTDIEGREVRTQPACCGSGAPLVPGGQNRPESLSDELPNYLAPDTAVRPGD